MNDIPVGLKVTHRRYVTYGDAHYGGNLVNGAFVLELFGDVGTEASIRMDGDEGLLASYSDVQFLAPVLAGDVIEVTATVIAVGQAQQEARVRGAGGLPGRPGTRRVRGDGAHRAGHRRHRHRDRGGAASGAVAGPPPFTMCEYHDTIFTLEGGGGHAAVQIPGPGDA